MKKGSLAVLCGMLVASFALADDWPQFRGPDRSGVSKEKGLLKEWPKGGPKLAWTFKDAGLGFSSFAISKGVVYTLGTDHPFDKKGLAFDAKGLAVAKDEYVIAIDEKTGQELWRTRIGVLYTYKFNTYGDGPRSTPTVDGDFLYALGGLADLVCLDLANKGKEVWRKNLEKDLGGVIMDKYGWSESPLIDGKHLICTPGGPKGTLAALDKTNGNVVWRSKGMTQTAPFASPIVVELNGVRQYIQTSYDATLRAEFGAISGFDAKTGNVLWSGKIFDGTNDSNGIGTTPLVVNNHVFASTIIGGCHLFDLKGMPKEPAGKYSKALSRKIRNAHGGVVLIDGHIFGHSEPGMWFCQNFKTGKLAWDERQTLNCKSGAVTAAEGLLYLYTDDGEVGLVAADPAEFKLISTFAIPQKSTIPGKGTSRQSRMWTYPVVANGHLYLRDHEHVFAFKIN